MFRLPLNRIEVRLQQFLPSDDSLPNLLLDIESSDRIYHLSEPTFSHKLRLHHIRSQGQPISRSSKATIPNITTLHHLSHTSTHHGHCKENPQIRHNQASNRPTRRPPQRKPRQASQTPRLPLQSPRRRTHPRNPPSTLPNVLLPQHRPRTTLPRSHRHQLPLPHYSLQTAVVGNTYGYVFGDGEADDYELCDGGVGEVGAKV